MIDRKWFVPTEGMTIPDPHTKAICPPEGQWVDASSEYWIRRALDGGGTLADSPPPGTEAHE